MIAIMHKVENIVKTRLLHSLFVCIVGLSIFPPLVVTAQEVVKPAISGADAPKEKPEVTVNSALAPLEIEETGRVETLPSSYPETWVIVGEAAFFHMASGKMIILDLAEQKPSKRIKGIIDSSLLGNFGQSKTRNELYLMESFHKRGTRGPKEDVLSVYDKQTLTIKKEIVWPKPNRLQSLPERFAIGVSEDERFLFSANFDPAASFTVIDLKTHEIASEIGTPGCVLTFPIGKRAVGSLCSNGSMLSTLIDNQGQMVSQSRTEPFFDTDKTPIFEHPVYIDGIAYFWSFQGVLHSFDMRGDEAKYLGQWDPRTDSDIAGGWRPSGLILLDVDDAGNIYTIFQKDGQEGTQTHGGDKIRVHDPVNKKLVREFDAPRWAISIGVTRGKKPLLVATNGELSLDVFDARNGEFIQTISDFGNSTPLSFFKAY